MSTPAARTTAEVVLLNPSYVWPPFTPSAVAALRDDPLMMDLPSAEFLYPPVGLLTIGGALRRAGFRVEGFDCNTRAMPAEAVAQYCEGARIVGISLLVANLRATYILVQHMKRRGYTVVLGGAYPSVEPAVVAWMGLRYGIAGEGEVAFTRLCAALLRGEGRPEDIDGIIIAEDSERVFTRPPQLLTDLDPYMPDRSLMRQGTYKLPFSGPLEVALASRGCPFRCTFCYCSSPSPASMFTTHRTVGIEAMVHDLMETQRNYKPRYIEMLDETFSVDKRYTKALLRAMIAAGFSTPFGAKTRIDLVDDELLGLMAQAGLRKLGFGLESGVYDHRRAMRKDFSNDRARGVFDEARRLGIETATTIIFGHPDETIDEMRQSVAFVQDIRAAYVEFHIMVLIPGTDLFRRAVAEGKVQPDVYRRFMLGEVEFPEYAPGSLGPEDMRTVHRQAIWEYYFRPSFVADTLRRVRRPGDLLQYARTARSLLQMSEVKRPIWALGRDRL